MREALADARVGDGYGEGHYFNFAMALLGIALAEQAEPAEQAGAATGSTASGRYTDPWQASGLAGAGIGPWSTAPDLAALIAAMLDGGAPGADAAQPRFDAGEDSWIGYGWFTTSYDGRPYRSVLASPRPDTGS